MLKKITLLAIAAGVLAALVPAGASATWIDKGVALKAGSNPKIPLTGTLIKYTSIVTGGVTCHSFAEIELTGGVTTGFMTKFEPVTSATASCTTSGVLANEGCVIEKLTPTELPWVLHNNTPTLTISLTTKTMHTELRKTVGVGVSQPCPKFSGADFTPGTLTLTPDNSAEWSTLVLSGTLKHDPGELPVTFSGTFDVLAPNIKTFGL